MYNLHSIRRFRPSVLLIVGAISFFTLLSTRTIQAASTANCPASDNPSALGYAGSFVCCDNLGFRTWLQSCDPGERRKDCPSQVTTCHGRLLRCTFT